MEDVVSDPQNYRKKGEYRTTAVKRFPPLDLPEGWIFAVDSNELAGDHLGYRMETRKAPRIEPVVRKLLVADYSVVDRHGDVHDDAAVERKSLANVFSDLSNGKNRARLEKCYQRMSELAWPAVVIEAEWDRLGRRFKRMDRHRSGPRAAGVHPNAVQGTLLAWAQRYRVPTYFVESRWHGERVTRWILAKYAIEFEEGRVMKYRRLDEN